MNEVVFRVGKPLDESGASVKGCGVCRFRELIGTYLVDDLIPFLSSDSDLDGFLHQACRDDDTTEIVIDAPRRASDLGRHGLAPRLSRR